MSDGNKETTLILTGLLSLGTLSALQIWAPLFASTPQLTIVGGFVSALVFVFSLLFVGNLFSETRWPQVILCEFIACFSAALVHRVCVTTCFLFSIGLLYLLNSIHLKQQSRKQK